MSDKVTVRFESTMDSANSEPLLLSGPIQIFASVDVFKDIYSEDNHKEPKFIGLDNKELMMAIKDASDVPQIVVFVNDVGNVNDNSQPHRGSYFLFVGDRDNIMTDYIVERDWQEILLGTHSHSNIEQLNSLAELPYGKKDKIVAMDTEGNFKLIDNPEFSTLPPLPIEWLNKIKEREDLNLKEPTENEWHHLDADLSELSDTYDWLKCDKDGNYKNLAVGNCKKLYHSLLKSQSKLYITNEGKLSSDGGVVEVALEVYQVNFNPNKKIENSENVILDSTNFFRTLLKLNLPCAIKESDGLMFFINEDEKGDRILQQGTEFELFSREIDNVTLRFNKNKLKSENSTLTVLIFRNIGSSDLSSMEIYDFFENGNLTLNDINRELIKQYIKDELSVDKNPKLPTLYLATDEYGNIHWENKLLPTQYFYKNTIVVTEKTKDSYLIEKIDGKFLKIKFEDTFFNIESGDVPLLLIDSYFAFDITPVVENEKDLVYYINIENKYINWDYDNDIIDSTSFTLIIIKNSAGGSLAREIAENYVSKDDAVKILSHGKISLKDYAKATDLIAYSRIGHTHSQYALKDHNHDYKYANYHHTHPELSAILATNTGLKENDVERWVNELTGGIKNLADEVEANLKENVSLEDIHIAISPDVILGINEKIKKDNYGMDTLNENSTLKEVLDYFVRFFELEYVYADSVKLPQTIVVTNPVGGIKKDKYTTEATVFDVLRDLLNPLTTAEENKKKLTPSPEHSKVTFYSLDTDGNPKVIPDPLKIKTWIYGDKETLLFKISLKNSNNEDCMITTYTGVDQYTTPLLKNEKYIFEGSEYFVYDHEFDFQNEQKEYPLIKISWENEEVADSYGTDDRVYLNPNNDFIEIQPEFGFIYRDYYTCVLVEDEFKLVENQPNLIYNYEYKMQSWSGDNNVKFDLHTTPDKDTFSTDYICILCYYRTYCEYDILDNRGNSIYEYFNEKAIIDGEVIMYFYPVLYEPVIDGDEQINSLTLTIKKIEKEV